MPAAAPIKHVARGEEFPVDYLTEKSFVHDAVASFEILKRDALASFEYIEPSEANLTAYSLRFYELLIRSSTEVESLAKAVFRAQGIDTNGLTIKKYSDLEPIMRLSEYEVKLYNYSLPPIKPFESFANSKRDERGPDWYRSYNNVKHNRQINFSEASLGNMLHALAGAYILLNARIGLNFDVISRSKKIKFDLQIGGNALDGEGWMPYKVFDLFEITSSPEWAEDLKFDWNWFTKYPPSESVRIAIPEIPNRD